VRRRIDRACGGCRAASRSGAQYGPGRFDSALSSGGRGGAVGVVNIEVARVRRLAKLASFRAGLPGSHMRWAPCSRNAAKKRHRARGLGPVGDQARMGRDVVKLYAFRLARTARGGRTASATRVNFGGGAGADLLDGGSGDARCRPDTCVFFVEQLWWPSGFVLSP